MSWFSDLLRPQIKSDVKARNDTPKDLWTVCQHCDSLMYIKDLPINLGVCYNCGYHNPVDSSIRFQYLFDKDSYTSIDLPHVMEDPLHFVDTKSYTDRLKTYRKKTGQHDALQAAYGKINGYPVVIACMDFAFMGGSMGMYVGQGIVTAIQYALDHHCGFIMITSSGGARMQEGIFSLIQMVRTSLLIQKLTDEHLPYIVLLAHPTTGGVTASFAMLGDIHMAEPGAVIGFTGRRVIEQTVKEKLPDNFQTAEYLLDKGMIDTITKRKDQKKQLAQYLRTFSTYM